MQTYLKLMGLFLVSVVVLGNSGIGGHPCPYTNPKFAYRGTRIVEQFVDYARWQYKTECLGNCTADVWVEVNGTECLGICPDSKALERYQLERLVSELINHFVETVVFDYIYY